MPPPSKIAGGLYAGAIFGAIFIAITVGMTFVFAAVAGPMAIVPAIMTLFGFGLLINGGKQIANFRASPLQRYEAAVIDERVKVTGGGKNSSASTKYFVTLEREDGQRKESEAIESVAAKVAPGDIGIAFTKGAYLIEYIRVPV
jgi:hypothetical protein